MTGRSGDKKGRGEDGSAGPGLGESAGGDDGGRRATGLKKLMMFAPAFLSWPLPEFGLFDLGAGMATMQKACLGRLAVAKFQAAVSAALLCSIVSRPVMKSSSNSPDVRQHSECCRAHVARLIHRLPRHAQSG